MIHTSRYLREASPNEKRTISREHLGFYNAVVVAGIYETTNRSLDLRSPVTFYPLLEKCIQQHTHLSMIVKAADTDQAFFEQMVEMDIKQHVVIQQEISTAYEDALSIALDLRLPTNAPPWRIVVQQLQHTTTVQCLVAFAFSHALGDGMTGHMFHQTFLLAWRQYKPWPPKRTSTIKPIARDIPEAFDTPDRLRISWKYLLAPILGVYLPQVVADFFGFRAAASTIDEHTWTGSLMKSDSLETRFESFEVGQLQLQALIRTCRKHNVKLTAILHLLIVRALSKLLPVRWQNLVSTTAIDMRRAVGVSGDTWGLYVSGYYHIHSRSHEDFTTKQWQEAYDITKQLNDCALRLQDQAIGLLRFLPSIKNWTRTKPGHQRDASYEVSNLLTFHDAAFDESCKIVKMLFLQPANVMSAPLVFNIISVKEGPLTCAMTWQDGALDLQDESERTFVQQIASSMLEDIRHLCEDS